MTRHRIARPSPAWPGWPSSSPRAAARHTPDSPDGTGPRRRRAGRGRRPDRAPARASTPRPSPALVRPQPARPASRARLLPASRSARTARSSSRASSSPSPELAARHPSFKDDGARRESVLIGDEAWHATAAAPGTDPSGRPEWPAAPAPSTRPSWSARSPTPGAWNGATEVASRTRTASGPTTPRSTRGRRSGRRCRPPDLVDRPVGRGRRLPRRASRSPARAARASRSACPK